MQKVITHKSKIPLQKNNKIFKVDQGFNEIWSYTLSPSNQFVRGIIPVDSTGQSYWHVGVSTPGSGDIISLSQSGALFTIGTVSEAGVLTTLPPGVSSTSSVWYAGYSVSSSGPLTVSEYSQNLQKIQSLTYSSQSNAGLKSIHIDSLSNIYVGANPTENIYPGSTFSLKKYNNSGVLQWQIVTSDVNVTSIKTDSSWVYFANAGRSEIKRYNTNGASGSTLITSSYSIGYFDLDNSGNIYTYEHDFVPTPKTVQVRKFNSSGTLQWTRLVGTFSTSGYYNWPLVVDKTNSRVYVSVPYVGIVILDSSGNFLSTITFGPQSSHPFYNVGLNYIHPYLYCYTNGSDSGYGGYLKKLQITL